MSNTPEQRLANRIVDLHDLKPPVDIWQLAQEYADVEVANWPHDCDGLTIGLSSGRRPKIFIKKTSNKPRERFTVGHELGHIVLPWHVEEIACVPEINSGTTFHGGLREREASTFASHLLVPDKFVQAICRGNIDVPFVIREVEVADISAAASLIAVVRALPPGFAFVLDSDRIFSSHGTVLPTATYDHWKHRGTWSAQADASGRVRLRGKSVRWFKFEAYEEPELVHDPRSTTQLLRDAIAVITGDAQEQARLLNVVNGVIGYAMTEENRSSPARALAAMRHRLRGRPDLLELAQEPDFELFLSRRAIAHSNS